MSGGLWSSTLDFEGADSFRQPPSSPPPALNSAAAYPIDEYWDAVPPPSSSDLSPDEGGSVEGNPKERGEQTPELEFLADVDILAEFGDYGVQSLKEGPAVPPGPAILTEDLCNQIVRQVEYYFSDENLPTDEFLLKYVKRDKKGFVPIAVIASFKRMKKLTNDLSLVETALRTSSQLVVSVDGKKVKRLRPLTITETNDSKSRTVVVENLPEDCSTDYIQRVFGKLGNVKSITLNDPEISEKPRFAISNKVHSLVEYETVREAENAVSSLNDEKNWRSGMRVQILLNRMGKYGLTHKGQKGTISEKKNNIHQVAELNTHVDKVKSVDHNDEMVRKEDHELAEGAKKKRGKGRGKSNIQSNVNALGHGAGPLGAMGNNRTKPIPGPRMPDGTRGFTMGRGKLPVKEV